MTNTQKLIVLRAMMRGKTIGEATKALTKASNAFNERLELYYQHIYNMGQIIECKYILEEMER